MSGFGDYSGLCKWNWLSEKGFCHRCFIPASSPNPNIPDNSMLSVPGSGAGVPDSGVGSMFRVPGSIWANKF
jgi:hypothetical protein